LKLPSSIPPALAQALADALAPLAHDGLFWRRLAHLGASRGPEWLVRYTPPFWGCAAAVAVPSARHAITANLRRVRGKVTPLRDAVDVARTFSTYASCLAEVLSSGSKSDRTPEAVIYGERHIDKFMSLAGRGGVFVTAHTAGWELVGPLLSRDHKLSLMMVMERERDPEARRLQDEARTRHGVQIVHVGRSDPLASLPLLRHVRGGGIAALQIDRNPPGMKSRAVEMFGAAATIPEGPLRLAQLAGVPILPIFAGRTGYRSYFVRAYEPIVLARRASEAELDAAAQRVADAMTDFVGPRVTQWFHFGGD
jgi:lauroyl/myristoyl acyltransferase